MEGFLEFLANNYVWFLMVAILLVFALIGYLIDNKSGEDTKIEEKSKPVDIGIQTIQNKSLNEVIEEKGISTPSEVVSTPDEPQGLSDVVNTVTPENSTTSETLTIEEK